MSEKIQNNFYLLKETKKEFKKLKIVEEKIDFTYLKKLFREKQFKEQTILSNLSKEYEIKLYYKKTTTPIKWKDFIKTIVNPNQEILKSSYSTSESYIIIFYNSKTKKYFASTGGYAHVVVQEIATNDFGLEILSRILKADDKALRSSKERNLTGGIQGSIKFFRNDYNLYENESFGNIYNELNASINKDQLVKVFGFAKHNLKLDSLCIAKNSFSLKKSISFTELLNIIEKCENLIKTPKIVEINSVEKISKSDSVLLYNLWVDLNQKIYANYINPNTFFSVEISNKDFEKYYYANSTTVSISIKNKVEKLLFEEGIRNIQTILDQIRILDSSLSLIDFEKCIDSGYIETIDENGSVLTRDSLKNHFCTEVSLSGSNKSYFLIEKDWYEIGKTFIDKINEQSTHFITSNKYKGPKMEKWLKGTENEYNSKYFKISNSFVFDKFTPENIEACDVMRWDNEKVYFYHVKKGFNNSMRDLCNQIFIASRKIKEDSKNGYIFLDLLYETVTKNKGVTNYSKDAKKYLFKNITKSDFKNLVKDRTFVFVLAVLDDSVGSIRKLETDIDKFESNIAKFSLNELCKGLRNLEVEFQILQLER
ncbi:TIGR04141 family sporadically distributed protein [Flavobacterium sp. JLP]|uniref:DUF6119 family protein n=1 Tax=Flavobacterium sp. JLP TaxID=2783793 RepID=UPI00188A2A5C|nr:DUF6119 family protein [Flavobacterium sp. JLP]MBF4508418.1 TIGR04141 family sporadically distributed protein [Flavobacterium sp. JLP]